MNITLVKQGLVSARAYDVHECSPFHRG